MAVICDYGTHRTVMMANRKRDTIEFIQDRSGRLTISAWETITETSETGRSIITLSARQATELKEFLRTKRS
jgi:hypothetical protein